MSTTTLAQERSAFALQQVKDLKGDRDKFAKFISGVPAMILQNGFGQTLSFMLAKRKKDKHGAPLPDDKHTQAFFMISRWLSHRKILDDSGEAQTIGKLCELRQSDYLRAQEEALTFLEWVKRYANAGLFQ